MKTQEEKVSHTPGEWRIGDGGWTIFGPPNGKPAPAVIATLEQGKSMVPSERRANARLISAAPDLLDACKALLEEWNSRTATVESCDFTLADQQAVVLCEQAIAKATQP